MSDDLAIVVLVKENVLAGCPAEADTFAKAAARLVTQLYLPIKHKVDVGAGGCLFSVQRLIVPQLEDFTALEQRLGSRHR